MAVVGYGGDDGPDLGKGSKQPFAQVTLYRAVSCAPAGTCAYTNASNHAQGYITQAR